MWRFACMWKRSYWLDTIEEAWRTRPLIWLSVVRRAGKTVLSQSLEGDVYVDCELPRPAQLRPIFGEG